MSKFKFTWGDSITTRDSTLRPYRDEYAVIVTVPANRQEEFHALIPSASVNGNLVVMINDEKVDDLFRFLGLKK